MLRQYCDPKMFMYSTPPAPIQYGRGLDVAFGGYLSASKTGTALRTLDEIECNPAQANTSEIAIVSA